MQYFDLTAMLIKKIPIRTDKFRFPENFLNSLYFDYTNNLTIKILQIRAEKYLFHNVVPGLSD